MRIPDQQITAKEGEIFFHPEDEVRKLNVGDIIEIRSATFATGRARVVAIDKDFKFIEVVKDPSEVTSGEIPEKHVQGFKNHSDSKGKSIAEAKAGDIVSFSVDSFMYARMIIVDSPNGKGRGPKNTRNFDNVTIKSITIHTDEETGKEFAAVVVSWEEEPETIQTHKITALNKIEEEQGEIKEAA